MKSLLEIMQYLYICFIIGLGKLFKMLLPSQGHSAFVIFTLKSDHNFKILRSTMYRKYSKVGCNAYNCKCFVM